MASLDAINDRLIGLNANGAHIKVSPAVATVDSALSVGQVLGEWSKVKPFFDAAGFAMPQNTKVYGADSAIYKLTGSSSASEPSSDGANWTKLDLGSGAVADGVVNAGSVVGSSLRLTTDNGQTITIDVSSLITLLNSSANANAVDDTKALTAAGLVEILQAGMPSPPALSANSLADAIKYISQNITYTEVTV
jgi:hypothetical protein